MAGIKSCIAKFKDFPNSLKNRLISLSDSFKERGKSDFEADTEALHEVHKELHDELNDLKRQVKVPVKKYSRPDTQKEVEKVKKKHKKEDEMASKKEAELEDLATQGNDINPEGMTEREYVGTVLSESTSPGEIAGAWIGEYESNYDIKKNYDEGRGSTNDVIYAFFKNGGRLSIDRFKKFGDKNLMGISAKSTYFSKNGKSADTAISLNDGGDDVNYVSPQDIVDFIQGNPRGLGVYEQQYGDNKASQLHGKFIKLTGRRLTPKFARELFKKYLDVKEKEAATLPPITEKEAAEELEKEAARDKQFAETGQFQKKTEPTKAQKADVDKVMERMKKVLPKFNIVYNKDLDAAGKIDGNKIEINPFYAGTDTPIHEVGHALIDFIGYKNRVIQAGIRQLKGTQFYKDVAADRPELTGELLDKEVLAEAIGKEGAGIFTKEVDKSRFKQVLDYIFTKLKQLLGIDKNIAKSLAKQIVGGIGTKGVAPAQTEGKSVTLQMPSGERVDGKEVQVDVVNGFYSNLEKQMLQIKLEKLPAKQWKDKLTGEEAKWTGLTDWLTSKGQQPVTRKEIKDFLKENRISIVEVQKMESKDVFDNQESVDEVYNSVREEFSRRDKIYLIDEDGDNPLDRFYNDPNEDTYYELVEFGDRNNVFISELPTEDTSKFSQYQLEGEKSNYKEVLITMPNKIPTYGEYQKQLGYPGNSPMLEKQYLEKYGLKQITDRSSKEFKSSHFEEPNILVHLRMNTRTDAEGNKVLFLEEVQSDWGQKGKKEGFANNKDEKIELSSIKEEKEYEAKGYYIQTDMNTRKTYAIKEALKGTPQAPFVTDTNAWTKLGLKVALKEAVKQGADKIAWTTGEQQNDRYDLSKIVDNIEVSNQGEGVGYKVVGMKGGNVLMTQFATAQQLPDVIGKELAQKIIDAKIPYQKTKVFSGVDLKVGGKGMIGFYGSPKDNKLGIVGEVAKKLFKQEPKTTELTEGKWKEEDGRQVFEGADGTYIGDYSKQRDGSFRAVDMFGREKKFDNANDAKDYIYNSTNFHSTRQHSVDITPELISEVGGGLPMFQKSKKADYDNLTDAEKKVRKLYKSIKDIEDLSAVPWKDMLAAYNYLITTEGYSQMPEGKSAAKEFLRRMGISFFQEYSDKVKTDPKYSPEKAAKKDIKGWDVAMKALSHFTAEFPELKGLSELYNEAFFNKITESAEKKRTNEKLAEAVIKDRHQRLGIAERVKEGVFNLFGNRNYKYFDFLEGKDGNFITVKEAEKKGLSKAQIDYLKFARNVVASREAVVDNLGENWNNELQILRNDKKFYESFATENVVSAFSSLLGNTWNINNVRIEFTNPETGKEQTTEYENIEKILVKYGKKGVLQKANAIRLIAKYNVRARSQLAENVNRDEKGDSNVLNAIRSGDYSLTTNGKLQSKFDKPRNPSRPYSKDFYSAINEYIDDTEHIQHMQPLVPIINAIDYLNKGVYDSDGNEIHYKKKNVTDWLKDWSDFHILKKPAPVILGKYESERAALALRFFRNAASLTMMMFNVPAQLRNAAMGIYNTWRKENGATVARGMKRVFGGKKGYDIIKKYKASSTDIDSNPIVSAGGAITSLGYALTKWGEFLVQGSQFLGMMDEKDYNSFEYKKNKFGVDELVVKQGVDEKALQKRMLDLVDRVSDVQGKYSEKDRRNIQNNELGKSIMQYRVWLPDWWRIRFSKDAGSWRNMFSGEVKEMKKQISEKGVVKAFWEDKNFMSNFKEVSMITLLLALLYSDDEDEEKSMASKQAMKVLSEMVGVVDPNNMKQIIERPVASMGVVTRVLDAFDHLIMLEADDFYKKDSKYGKKGDPKIIGDIRGAIPGKQAIDLAEEALEDED